MRHLVFPHRTAVFAAAILFTLLPVQVSGERLLDDPNLLRAEVVKIDPVTVRSWASAKRGAVIVLPWFDGSRLVATAERVEEADKFMMVVATVKAEIIGNVVLTIGDDVLAGAITIDNEGYRLRSLGGDAYSLVQFDTDQLMPTTPDTNDQEMFNIGLYEQPQFYPARPSIEALPPRELFEQLNKAQLVVPGIFENGLQIDVLVAYSHEAEDWAKDNGYNLGAEIVTMIGITNMGLARSGIVPRLRLVGVAHVDYSVTDPDELQGDLVNLGDGAGTLGILHDVRDLLRADLVSLLVFNGTEKCGKGKPGCGWAMQSNMFLGLGDDHPGTFKWEQDFASKGFNVVSVYHAINAATFMHEVGHNLGAHHDWYTYYHTDPPPSSTADVYAHGWVIWENPNPARTVMSYSGLCDVPDPAVDCELLPIFSNPLRSYFGRRLGDPAPGGQPHLVGPADNATAINRMAPTVSSYRIAAPTP